MRKLALLPFLVSTIILVGCSQGAETAASKACGGPFVKEAKLAKEHEFAHNELEVTCNDGSIHRVKFE